jgi:glutaminyl-peptide cyclotransferase
MNNKRILIYLAAIGLLLVISLGWYARSFLLTAQLNPTGFDGKRALSDVQTQVAFGPRIPGSAGHADEVKWIQAELKSAGWDSRIQQTESLGHTIANVVAYRGNAAPQLILGAHYDTRIYADRDPDPARQKLPTPGANNGGSGVAVLLELARTLPSNGPPIWMVFFDAEDDGKLPGWDWTLGSKAFVADMTVRPQAMVLVDMVGGTNATFYMDGNSDTRLRTSIWSTAAQLGYQDAFVPSVKYDILDDHIPFVQAGIPSVDIIDIDDPNWLTTSDTPEHVSARSLQMVGSVLSNWITTEFH